MDEQLPETSRVDLAESRRRVHRSEGGSCSHVDILVVHEDCDTLQHRAPCNEKAPPLHAEAWRAGRIGLQYCTRNDVWEEDKRTRPLVLHGLPLLPPLTRRPNAPPSDTARYQAYASVRRIRHLTAVRCLAADVGNIGDPRGSRTSQRRMGKPVGARYGRGRFERQLRRWEHR